MEPTIGIEPITPRLRSECSTGLSYVGAYYELALRTDYELRAFRPLHQNRQLLSGQPLPVNPPMDTGMITKSHPIRQFPQRFVRRAAASRDECSCAATGFR